MFLAEVNCKSENWAKETIFSVGRHLPVHLDPKQNKKNGEERIPQLVSHELGHPSSFSCPQISEILFLMPSGFRMYAISFPVSQLITNILCEFSVSIVMWDHFKYMSIHPSISSIIFLSIFYGCFPLYLYINLSIYLSSTLYVCLLLILFLWRIWPVQNTADISRDITKDADQVTHEGRGCLWVVTN